MPQRPEQPYAVLLLKPGASMDEVRLAHRHLTAQWHPDRFTSDPVRQHEARDRLQQISEAYRAICDARGAEEDAAMQADLASGVRTLPQKGRWAGWRIPAGIAAALVGIAAAVLFPPLPQPEPSTHAATARLPASDANPDPTPDATAAGESAVKGTPLPWTVHAEPPAAPIPSGAEPLFPTNAAAQTAPVIWVPASSNAAATGMSWSLNSPGLRTRAVPRSSGGAKKP